MSGTWAPSCRRKGRKGHNARDCQGEITHRVVFSITDTQHSWDPVQMEMN